MRRGKASVLLAGGSPGAPDDGCHAKGCEKKLCAARGGQLLIEKSMRSCQMMALGCFVGLC